MGDTKHIINDINTLFVNIEDISENYINELSSISDNQISKYQIAINILFLILIVIILYILYRDYVYRIASKMSRCTDINDIIDFNTNNILKDYILRLEYNFIKEETNITFGDKNIISPVLFAPTDTISKISNAFSIFDLEEKKKKFIDYYNKDTQTTYNFDKKKLKLE